MLIIGSMINLLPGIIIKPFLINLPENSFEWVDEGENKEAENEEAENISMTYRILTGEQSVTSVEPIEDVQSIKDQEGSKPVQAEDEKDQTDIIATLDKYSSGRLQLWKSGYKRWKERPLFGEGLYRADNFIATPSDDNKGVVNISYFAMHNDYIQAYVSGGILGGTAFISYIAYVLLRTKRKFVVISENLTIEDRLKVGALLALVIGGLFAGMLLTVNYFDCFATGAIFWCYFGFLAKYVETLYAANCANPKEKSV